MQRIEQSVRTKANSIAASDSPGTRAYQKWFSQTLASHCRYFPSDSRYHVTLAKQCGPLTASMKSMSRWLLEYDAPKLGRAILSKSDGVQYEDLPSDCNWL